MISPNLIIPGFPKAGTSALHYYLSQHPEICTSYRKEPHTYSFEDRYIARFENSGKFAFSTMFHNYNNEKYILDASTTYLISDTAIDRIVKDCPNAKFIVVIRDPIERIESHYNWLKSLGFVNKNVQDEIGEWRDAQFDYRNHYYGYFKYYLQFSSYGSQLVRLYTLTEKENVMLVQNNDLLNDTENVLNEVFNFLNISSVNNLSLEKKNETTLETKVTRKWLKKITKIKRILPSWMQTMARSLNQPLKISASKEKFSLQDKVWLYNQLSTEIELMEKLNIIKTNWTYTNECKSQNN